MRRFLSLSLGVLLLAGIAVASSGGATHAETRWVITDLGTLGGEDSEALDVNDRGLVVGNAEIRHNLSHAFLWQKGRMRDLGTLGGPFSEAVALNDRGQVIGNSSTGVEDEWGDPIIHPFLWQEGKLTDLGIEGQAIDINDRGQVMIWGERGGGFLWQRGELIGLGFWPEAINDRGQVVGSVGESRAVLWQDGRMTRLGRRFPGVKVTRSVATAVNNRGQIVGWARTLPRWEHAALWDGSRERDLGTLGRSSFAYDINERGQVVGWSGVAPDTQHAFLWQDGKMRDLGFEGVVRYGGRTTIAINDRGQIVFKTWSGLFVWHDGSAVRLPCGRFNCSDVGVLGAINNRGQIVSDFSQRAVLWTLKR